MVYNTASKYAKLPFSNSSVHMHHKRTKTVGQGMGSVLLSTGGAGSASSYMDIPDYERTTGRKVEQGEGLKSLSKKLANLNIETGIKKPKRKNIVMSF